MGVSTNGEISFGILFEEGFEFPWDEDEYDDGIYDWWKFEVLGYKRPFELYDEAGEYIDGIKPPKEKREEYYAHERQFEKDNPKCPITLVNYCSGGCPMYILAVSNLSVSCSRGYPTGFFPSELAELIASGEHTIMLLEFCKRYGIETDAKPGWWLSSYWDQ